MSFIRAEYVGLLSQLGEAPSARGRVRSAWVCPELPGAVWCAVLPSWVALCPHHLPHQPWCSNATATPATLQQHLQHCSNTCNTAATPATLQQHLQHALQRGRGGGGLMKGQEISSCSSGHIAGDGGDQIDSPLQIKKEFSFSSCCMLSLSL